MKHKDKWYPFYTQKRGDTEKTFNHRLPKEIKSALDPLEGLQQNAQEIELMVETLQEINKQLEEHQKIADNENEDPVVRERAREKVRKDTERKAGFEREKNQLEQKREQLVERLPLREQARIRFKTLIERLKVLFKKHGFTIATVVTAVGITIGVVAKILADGASAAANGIKTVGKKVGDGLKKLGKKIGSILPGLVGAIASFVFRATKTLGSWW